jgi:hypothetical protein
MTLEQFEDVSTPVPNERVPEGIFYTIDEVETRGIIAGIRLGRELQVLHPEIAEDYRGGMTISEIIKKYDIINIYGMKPKTAENSVRYAISGYDGDIDVASGEISYPGLIQDRQELEKIAIEHHVTTGKKVGLKSKTEGTGIFSFTKEQRSDIGRKSGTAQYKNGIGIHAQTPEDHKRAGIALVEAQGGVVFSDEEVDYFKELILDPVYQRKSRINAQKISTELNRKFHNGKDIRTPKSITKINLKLKTR